MTNHNSPEEVSKRANQEDPIVMYLIVRESLGMGVGKTAAQCAHASQMLQLKYSEYNETWATEQLCGWSSTIDLPLLTIFRNWLNTSFRKVVLRADDKEWLKVKELSNHIVVIDAGITEIAAGSETVIGLWPMYKSEAQKTIVKKLQALK